MNRNYSKTENNGVQYAHSGDLAVEFFSKAGSMRSSARDGSSALDLFKPIWYSGAKELALRLLFWVRDPRGGAGNRNGFRNILTWLSNEDPKWVKANINFIPEYGRWDDVRSTFGTDVEDTAASAWAEKIAVKDFLASKWAKKKDKQILKALRKMGTLRDIGEFRRLLSDGRKSIVENRLCKNQWNEVEYEKLPSKAMSLYTNAFNKHDSDRFGAYKDALVSKDPKKKAKINASVLFPHDCLRTAEHGDPRIANAQFDALPNFMENNKYRILSIVDSSGSMEQPVGGSVRAIDVSRSLGLYCSDRLGKDNPFYRKYLQFSGEAELTDWAVKEDGETPYTFSGALKQAHLFDNSIGSTDIVKALNTILNFAKLYNASDEQIPNCILIISDMQFNGGGWNRGCVNTGPEVSRAIDAWEKAGYSRPKIVYWNTCGNEGSPERSNSKDVGLVSGFSPAILSSILGGKDFTPLAIMEKALEKYKVNVPE